MQTAPLRSAQVTASPVDKNAIFVYFISIASRAAIAQLVARLLGEGRDVNEGAQLRLDAEVIRANRAVLAVNNAVLMKALFGLQDGVDAKVKMVVWEEFAPKAVRIVFEAIAIKTSVALRKDNPIVTEVSRFMDFLGVEPCMVFTVSDDREPDNPKSSFERDPKMPLKEDRELEAMDKAASLAAVGRRTINVDPDCTWWDALKRNRLLSLLLPYYVLDVLLLFIPLLLWC
jgi:hypothetical protein